MSFEDLTKAFLKMKRMVEGLHCKSQGGDETLVKYEGEGGGEKPPDPPSSPSSSSSSSSDDRKNSTHKKKPSKKYSHSHDFPLLKLDVKFDLPIYDG
jgi:hypothetical protein